MARQDQQQEPSPRPVPADKQPGSRRRAGCATLLGARSPTGVHGLGNPSGSEDSLVCHPWGALALTAQWALNEYLQDAVLSPAGAATAQLKAAHTKHFRKTLLKSVGL